MEAARQALARRIKELREAHGLSQRALAKLLPADHAVITRAESGKRPTSPQLAAAIGRVLGAEDELRGLAEQVEAAANDARAREQTAGWAPRSLCALPRAVRIIGRDRELDRLEAFLAPRSDGRIGASEICLVTGLPGIGKTAVAVAVAHRHAERFDGGCMYVDMRGFTSRLEPVATRDALGLLLEGLGVPKHDIPADEGARSVLLRGETKRRPILLVLDNATSAEQIEALLPASEACRVLVTSRRRLPALDDAHVLELGPLSRQGAADLFTALNPAGRTGRDAVRDLVDACGGHPLAIRIVGGLCRADPSLDPAGLAAELARPGHGMETLEDGERSVARAFDLSFALLPDAARRTFALLGVQPALLLEPRAVAALADCQVTRAERTLHELFLAGLLDSGGPGRYRMHDLLARYARRMAQETLPAHEIRAAVRRLLDTSLLTADEADLMVTPRRHRPPSIAVADGKVGTRTFASVSVARAWLTDSLDSLAALCDTAYEYEFDEHCWQLAYTLRGILFLGKHWSQWERSHTAALAAARRSAAPRPLAMTLNNLGLLRSLQGRYGEAEVLLDEALAVSGAARDGYSEHTARSHRAWVLHCVGRYQDALAEQRAVLAFHERVSRQPRNIAIVKRDMAATEIELGLLAEAAEHLRDAATAFAELGLKLDGTMTLNTLGEAADRTGDPRSASVHHTAALAAAFEVGSAFEQARACAGLGHAALRTGHPARARHQLTRALRLFTQLGAAPQAAEVRRDLKALARGDGRRPTRGTPAPGGGEAGSR
jgi:transcriptional regulator with XRE-family HTH domain/tetratricopeptide (TPR) repeat protein